MRVHFRSFLRSYQTYIVERNKRLGPAALVVADGVEDAVTDQSGQQLLNEESQEHTTDRGQVEVVDHEQEVELERRAIAHDFPAAKDDDVVGDEHRGGGLEGGHGRDALLELEFFRGIAHDGLVAGVEDGPEVDAERTVERGRPDIDDGLEFVHEGHGRC